VTLSFFFSTPPPPPLPFGAIDTLGGGGPLFFFLSLSCRGMARQINKLTPPRSLSLPPSSLPPPPRTRLDGEP